MSVIFKTLIATVCLLICVVSIRSDSPDNAKFTDTSIIPEDLHNTNISPRVTPKRHKRVVVFRPLFVYRQQQIKKNSIKGRRRRSSWWNTRTTSNCTTNFQFRFSRSSSSPSPSPPSSLSWTGSADIWLQISINKIK